MWPCQAIWAAVGVPVFGNQSAGIAAAIAIVDPTCATNSFPSPAAAPSSAVSIAVSCALSTAAIWREGTWGAGEQKLELRSGS